MIYIYIYKYYNKRFSNKELALKLLTKLICIDLLLLAGFKQTINNKGCKRFVLILNDKNLNKLKKIYNLIISYKNNNNNNNDLYNIDIINELISFEIGTKSEIMNAMDNVINRNDINEIVEYITDNKINV